MERRKDAEALLNAGRYQASVYMAGYVVECILKAAICWKRGELYLPAADQTHELATLLERASLRQSLDREPTRRLEFDTLVRHWHVQARYKASGGDAVFAARILTAATSVAAWVRSEII